MPILLRPVARGDGAWFGESPATLRLGFGYLPIDVLAAALDPLSRAIETALLRR
ncbi:hypothetical protein AB6802_08070 [Mesorhizobium sp. RCC_202]|uniref:hypothetical protein n=1 Tax=Mesorhizobium sp. RCC_202 TaxID=3239222 RepID=UPI0035254663